MSCLRYAVEDRKADAVTHLANARSQNTENGISGKIYKRESGRESDRLFLLNELSLREETSPHRLNCNITMTIFIYIKKQ